ncbi:serine/threonine-protein kinase ATR [Euwallacea fornicatus]|uniref:serine/threonine-protein kinase ATR n=1 Tax=Euwallacea fornicatus TaxID=995702 RepID=UPI00338EE0DF
MASLLLEEAFHTWKMLDDLVDSMLKSGTTDKNSIQTLANMVMSKQFSRTFIYTKEPGVTFQAYKDTVDKYHCFTTWLLGQFLYLLNSNDNDILVVAQISILDQLSRTQTHVYTSLAEEYCKGFNDSCEYLRHGGDSVRLAVFEPKKSEELKRKLNLNRASIELSSEKTALGLVRKLLKIVQFILIESVTFNSVNPTVEETLGNLVYLLNCSYHELEVCAVFINVLQRLHYNINNLKFSTVKKILEFFSLFEQLTYDFYNNKNPKKFDKDVFEDLLFQYLEECCKLPGNFSSNHKRIIAYIIKLLLENNNSEPSKEIQILCVDTYWGDLPVVNVNFLINANNSLIFNFLKTTILIEICNCFEATPYMSSLDAFKHSLTWRQFCTCLNLSWDSLHCSETVCEVEKKMLFCSEICWSLLDLKLEFFKKFKQIECSLYFFNGSAVMPNLLSTVAKHQISCKGVFTSITVLRFLVQHLQLSDCKNLDIIYHLIACPLLNFNTQMPSNYNGITTERNKIKADINALYSSISKDNLLTHEGILKLLSEFFNAISSGLIKNLNRDHLDLIEAVHLNLVEAKVCRQRNASELSAVVQSIPQLLYTFSNKDAVINTIFLPLLSINLREVQQSLVRVIPLVLCSTNSDFVRVFTKTTTRTLCQKCEGSKISTLQELCIVFSKNQVDSASLSITILKTIVNYLISSNKHLMQKALETLPALSQHVPKFFTPDVTKIWIQLCGDSQLEVRKALVRVIKLIISNGLDNPAVADDTKAQVLDIITTVLLKLTKQSLQYLEYDLQDTLLETITAVSHVSCGKLKLECMKIFLYLIMVPTSKYSFVAVDRCLRISKRNEAGLLTLYKQNSDVLCEVIVHLCYSNQYIVNASLQESLVKVSVMLGFDGVKDFVTKEAPKLLPYLVAKIAKNPKVAKLIQDMAVLMEVEVADLLTKNYGNIFLHLFLENVDREDSRKCLIYLETTTNLSGPKLRKLNFKVIFNELLLNFHEKRQKVLTTFQLLLAEDNNTNKTSIEDYIQPYFLPFLLYFDLELTGQYFKNEAILSSLADLLQFLGCPRIMPLRFKIIAMLQTGHYLKHPVLTCKVWDAFIHSCEIDCLGPHLATIFTSMLPLIETCPNDVNKIFRYLVVENEENLKEFIVDLFFVNNNSYIAPIVLSVIKRHLKDVEGLSFRQKIRRFLKYLKHDTVEVRVQSLRQVKSCLEQNREDLDQMVLGYNGIDGTLVELIDYLTLGCREKDVALKLACGKVFGELGAIESSHLPRRYTQQSQSFMFFISDNSFIESALTELIKAFQTDKNARNTDRVALAIQEILKTYEISPSEFSSRHFMWNKFSEAHREVMTPLLSSKYICVENSTSYRCPVYGSSDGSSFQAWLYNWTSSLINTLTLEKRSLLLTCYPSMKLDKRVLMHFLPYILLHSLLEGANDEEEKSYKEFVAVLSSSKVKRTADQTLFNIRPLIIPDMVPMAKEVTSEEEKQIKCTKVVFVLLDFLERWLREWQWHKGLSASNDRNYQTVKRFVSKFCKLELAQCNYNCGEYPRALLHLENYISENPDQVSPNLQLLAEIYAQLDEPDGVLGVEPLLPCEPSLEQKLLSLEVAGKLNDAVAVYEHMPRPLKLQHIRGLIQCYLDLDKVNTALYCAEGALDLQPEFGNMLLDMQAEALWRLGNYDDLEILLDKYEDCRGWGVQVGRSLICMKKGQRNEFKRVINELKRQQVDCFGAASLEEGAYHHGYSYITHLHRLTELAQLEKALFDLLVKPNDSNYAESILSKLSNEWQLRIKVVQESVRVVEPLLCLRRVALNLTKSIVEVKAPQAVPFLDKLLGETWLQSINVARTAGIHQQAYTYVLDAEKYNSPKLFIEKAKLHWQREEHEEALITLKRGLNVYIPDAVGSQKAQQAITKLSVEQRKLCAEARLLIANYNNDICSVDVETNLQQYKDAVEVFKEWEKSLVCLAQYQDRIWQNYPDSDRDTKAGEFQLHIVHNFGRSLYYGTTYVYHSMPRLLSIWFDYGTRLADVSSGGAKDERRLTLVKMTKIIDSFLNKLPAFVFLTSFSQIISRIAHPQKEVYVQLKSIIVKLVQYYPQQCLWMISSVIKSSYPIRAKRCAEILNDPRLRQEPLSRLIKDFTSLAEKLIELCNKEIPSDVNTASVNLLVRSLPRMLCKNFSEIMMPTHKFRSLILPNPDFKNTEHHNPFPNHYAHIVGIEDDISILNSLQRPRKISLKGSDGKSYTFMLKPKDDLRKDFRLMEFNDIVNQLMMRDAEARQRRLNIRLYSVAPLNEECGLIEWLNDLVGLRPILMNVYKQRGLGMKPREIKEVCCNIRDPLSKKRDVFTNVLLKRHPPVLGEWFRKTFPDAQTWFTARTGYIRTTAVISITGYMLGLGDRHGENILLDSTCGDVVHVDFNCLFNKGESFEWPERVPFRLTQNMIAAMGPLGVEGVFRKSCEFTLRVLRSNTATLMSIVTPFVYDPLVSWPRNVPASAQSSEKVNEQALEHIKNIELRLQGKVKTRNRTMSQCLSIEGQVDYLINEAKSVDNLCQMYVGWGPYL